MTLSIRHTHRLRPGRPIKEREWFDPSAGTDAGTMVPLPTAPYRTRRFDALSRLAEFYGRTLLDVGCGTGDFLAHLLNHDTLPVYTGLDSNGELIHRCKTRFHDRLGPLCRFETGEIMKYDPPKPFEYVVASGLLESPSSVSPEQFPRLMERLFSWCTVGLGLNFSKWEAAHSPDVSPADPPRVLDLALNLTPFVRLEHGYSADDFTVYLYRTAPVESGRTHEGRKGT